MTKNNNKKINNQDSHKQFLNIKAAMAKVFNQAEGEMDKLLEEEQVFLETLENKK